MARPAFPVLSPTIDESKMAGMVHLGAWIGQFLYSLNFIIPILVMCTTNSEFVKEHAREELNFQISNFIWLAVSAIACLVLIGFVGLIVFGLMSLICPLIAFGRARNGTGYRFPCTFRLV